MERSSKRGKIPQQDWPSIIKRYEAGETLASIARTYDCSPPAISYILSRSRERDGAPESVGQNAVEESEMPLLQIYPGTIPTVAVAQSVSDTGESPAPPPEERGSHAVEIRNTEPLKTDMRQAVNGTAGMPDRRTEIIVHASGGGAQGQSEGEPHDPPAGGGNAPDAIASTSAPPQYGEQRRTLHLSLSQDGPQRMDGPRHNGLTQSSAGRPGEGQQQAFLLHPGHQSATNNPSPNNDGHSRLPTQAQQAKENGSFIDQTLRERVNADISAFLTAFDAVLANDTLDSRAGLREATDRLLRAGARTRIELERLEARVPLPPRDNAGHATPDWRHR